MGCGEVSRVKNINVISEIFTDLYHVLSEDAKIDLLRKLVGIVRHSPYNGKILSNHPQLNLMRGVLGLLCSAESESVFQRLLNLVFSLSVYHMDVKQMKSYFLILSKLANNNQDPILMNSRYSIMLLYLQKSIQKRKEGCELQRGASTQNIRPRSFLDFDGLERKSGIKVAQFQLEGSSYSFCCWFRAETFCDEANLIGYQPRLFSFGTNGGGLIEAYFKRIDKSSQAILILQMKLHGKSSGSNIHKIELKFVFEPKVWYHISITHVYKLFGSSPVHLYVNGGMVYSGGLKYPNFTNQSLCFSYIGTNIRTQNPRAYSFIGQMAGIYFFLEELKKEDIKEILSISPSSANIPKNLSKKPRFAYSPESCYEKNIFEISVESTEKPQKGFICSNGVLLDGTTSIVSCHLKYSFFGAGGFDLIFSLFEMINLYSPSLKDNDIKNIMENNVDLRKQLGDHTGLILSLLAECLEDNLSLQREMENKKSFKLLHSLMKRHAPYNLNQSVIESIILLIKVLQNSKLFESFCKDFLFDFSLWCVGEYQFSIQYVVTIHQEIVKSTEFFRRIIGVSSLLDILKAYYWVTEDTNKASLIELKPKVQRLLPIYGKLPYEMFTAAEVVSIRRNILYMIKSMMVFDSQKSNDIVSVMSYLLNPPDQYQKDIVHIILQLLIYSGDTIQFVNHLESNESFYTFLYLLENNQESIRSISLRIIAILIKKGSKKLWKPLYNDSGVFNFILEQLQQHSSLTTKTFLSLFECSTGIITDSYFKRDSAENQSLSQAKSIIEPRFLMIIMELLKVASPNIRNDVILKLVDPILSCDKNMKTFCSLPEFPIWLENMITLSFKENSIELKKLMMKIYQRVFIYQLRQNDGYKFIELCFSYYFLSIERDLFYHFFIEELLKTCLFVKRKMEDAKQETQYTIIKNIAYLFILFEEYLFVPEEKFDDYTNINQKNRYLGLIKNDSGLFKGISIFIDLLSLVNIFFISNSNIENIQIEMKQQFSRDFYIILLHFLLTGIKESENLCNYDKDSNSIINTKVSNEKEKIFVLDDEENNDFEILGIKKTSNISSSKVDIFLEQITDKLQTLSSYIMKNPGNTSVIIWELDSIETSRKSLIAISDCIPLQNLEEEIIRFHKLEIEELLGYSFPEINEFRGNKELSQPTTFQLKFEIKRTASIEEEKYTESILWYEKRREIREHKVSTLSVETTHTHGEKEEKILEIVNICKKSSTKIDTIHASWLYHEEDKQNIKSSEFKRYQRVLLHHELYPYFENNNDNLKKYWKLDPTEDSQRRRFKQRLNYKGSDYKSYSMNYIRDKQQEKEITKIEKTLINEEFLNSFSEENIDENEDYDDNNNEKLDETDDWCVVDTKNFKDEETLLTVHCDLISMQSVYPGALDITKTTLYFSTDNTSKKIKNKRWKLITLKGIHRRRYLLRNTALEIFLDTNRSYLFDFKKQEREQVHTLLLNVANNIKDFSKDKTPKSILRHSNITQLWKERKISNFEYIMQLNTIAGRTYNDLSQYPIAPWILTDYKSSNIDLSNPNIYRDLSKPVGALNEKRFEEFKIRYENMPSDDPTMPRFLYGSHYSTALVVLYYLIRMEPFTKQYLELQGRFDHADRMFDSIETAFYNSYSLSQDVKELIPEFFYNPDFFYNYNELDLGTRQGNDKPINHVKMPPWASTPEEFVRIHKEALESDIVSENLHKWIDLIFGYKQRGKEAHKANNLFYYLTYEGAVNIDAIEDPILRNATIEQIISFGQTPTQLFTKPHPQRNINSDNSISIINNPEKFTVFEDIELKFIPIHIACSDRKVLLLSNINQCNSYAYTYGIGKPFKYSQDPHYSNNVPVCSLNLSRNRTTSPYIAKFEEKLLYSFGYWDNTLRCSQLRYPFSNLQKFIGHTLPITSAQLTKSGKYLVTGGQDCVLYVWKIPSSLISGKSQKYKRRIPHHCLKGHESSIKSIGICEDLDIVVSSSNEKILIHTLYTGEFVRKVASERSFISANIIKISSETGNIITYSNISSSISIFDLNGKFLGSESIHGNISQILIVNQGKTIITLGDKINLWDSSSLKIIQSFDLGSPVICGNHSPNESLLFVVLLVDEQPRLFVCPLILF